MSYDNSQLARVYLRAWQVTGNEFFRTITAEILASYSPMDADGEVEEGRFFG